MGSDTFFGEQQHICAGLGLDEMSIKDFIQFYQKTDTTEGFQDFEDVGSRQFVVNHALVFMLWGICTKWKTIAYFLSSGLITASKLKF